MDAQGGPGSERRRFVMAQRTLTTPRRPPKLLVIATLGSPDSVYFAALVLPASTNDSCRCQHPDQALGTIVNY